MKIIVLDVNCLLQIIPRKAPKRWLYDFILQAKVSLAISSEILMEYREILEQKTNYVIAENIINVLNELPNTRKIDPSYQWLLIKDDPDDDKYVDCAIAANAAYLISNDRHFDVLRSVDFPQVSCLKLTHVKKSMF
jgi:putative PIN family toxin of toxin-antitoxin system